MPTYNFQCERCGRIIEKNCSMSKKRKTLRCKCGGTAYTMINIPSIRILNPTSDATYLNGGRNVRKISGNGIGGIQVECPISVLKEDLGGVAKALNFAIDRFALNFLMV